MAQFITVRLRHPRGTSTIQLPSSHATFDLLLEAVAKQVGGCAAVIRLSTGYPPKVLRLGPSDLIAGHINDMDTVTYLYDAGMAQAASQAPFQPAPKQKRLAEARARAQAEAAATAEANAKAGPLPTRDGRRSSGGRKRRSGRRPRPPPPRRAKSPTRCCGRRSRAEHWRS